MPALVRRLAARMDAPVRQGGADGLALPQLLCEPHNQRVCREDFRQRQKALVLLKRIDLEPAAIFETYGYGRTKLRSLLTQPILAAT